MRRVGGVLVLAIGLVVSVYGCAAPQVSVSPAAQESVEPTASAAPGSTSLAQHDLTVLNGTALAVTMFVNGAMIETVPARSDRKFDPAALPGRPWDLGFKTSAGRVLLDYHVEPGWPTETVQADGSTMLTGWGTYVDLSCGRLLVLLDGFLPLPAPGQGTPGDCAA